MVTQRDNQWVYVASLSKSTPRGWRISWIDIVKKHGVYFHPMTGGAYPKEPPTYIAVRYDGKLQSIHHIESYEVEADMHTRIREIPRGKVGPDFVYKLGPGFGPSREVRTGKGLFRGAPARCMIDTLFTCNTIYEAIEVSKRRQER